ncbi:MAG: NusG domain II-containing protein [Desulfuromonadales bacterium]
MKTPWQVMTGGDWLVVLFLFGVSLTGIIWIATAPAGSRVVVTSGEQVRFTAPLGQPRSVVLDGPLGQTHLVIDDQGVRITESSCRQKICVAMGPASHTGDLLACVPNRILVRIDNPDGKEAPYDLLSR